MKVGDLEPFDAVSFLHMAEDRATFLSAAFEDGDLSILRKALLAAIRSAGMETVATAADVSVETLEHEFGPHGDPGFALVLKVLRAMGLRLDVTSS